MSQIKVHLNSAQYKKLVKDKTVQLKHDDLVNDNNKHELHLNVSKSLHNKYHRAVNSGCGIRLSSGPLQIHSGNLISLGCKLAKSVPTSFVRDVSRLGLNEGLKHISDNDQRNVAQSIGNLAINRAVGNGLFGSVARIAGKELTKKYVPEQFHGLSNDMTDALLTHSGVGLKGSPAMKAKMQALRNRKTGSGFSVGNVNRAFKIAAPIWEHALPIVAGLGVENDIVNIAKKTKKLVGLGIKGDIVNVANKAKKLVGLGVKSHKMKRGMGFNGGSMIENGGQLLNC